MPTNPIVPTARPLYRLLGTWKTSREHGAGRLARPQEINGLQAHDILRHRIPPETALARSVHDSAIEHSLAHANGVRHFT